MTQGNGVQVIKGVERRRRWSEEERARLIEESMCPGGSVLAVARKYDISPRLLHRWKEKMLASGQLVPIEAAAPAVPSGMAVAAGRSGRPPKAQLPAPIQEAQPPPRVFTVEPPGTAGSLKKQDGVRLIVGSLVITISTTDEA